MQEPDQYLLDLPELQERDRPTFANFIPGEENAEALAVLCEMAAERGPRFLYLYGPVGAGLTHLIEAYLPGASSAEVRVPIFDEHVRRYAVDDIEHLDAGYAKQLFDLQNAVYASPDARLVLAGHLAPKLLPLPEGVKNRLKLGPNYLIKPLEEEDRFRELRRLAALRGIVMTPDIEQWMAVHLTRSMRTLTRVLDVANQLALHSKRRVTLVLIRAAAEIVDRWEIKEKASGSVLAFDPRKASQNARGDLR